jgi:hypothetical protein
MSTKYGFATGFVTFVRLSQDGTKARVGLKMNRLDEEGVHVTFKNPQYATVLGFKPEETKGLGVGEFVNLAVAHFPDGNLAVNRNREGGVRYMAHKPCERK